MTLLSNRLTDLINTLTEENTLLLSRINSGKLNDNEYTISVRLYNNNFYIISRLENILNNQSMKIQVQDGLAIQGDRLYWHNPIMDTVGELTIQNKTFINIQEGQSQGVKYYLSKRNFQTYINYYNNKIKIC